MKDMKKTRILIADDHALLRMGLTAYVAGKNDLECVGEADNGKSAVELARKLRPDVVVMDLMMPGLSGAEATRLIRSEMPDVHVLVLTSFGTSRELSQAIGNGAAGAILKDAATEDIIAAIRSVAAGERLVSDAVAASQDDRPVLTERQKEVLQACMHGLSNAEIGKLFGISGETAKKHLSLVFEKLGVSTRAEAVALALNKNLLTPTPEQ